MFYMGGYCQGGFCRGDTSIGMGDFVRGDIVLEPFLIVCNVLPSSAIEPTHTCTVRTLDSCKVMDRKSASVWLYKHQ